MKVLLLITSIFVGIALSAHAEKYQANIESLSKHQAEPEWLKDAKLGIYFHWGVYSVPAYNTEWYPRHMHFAGTAENLHHLKTYGEIADFGYHDFVPMFKAEHFDPEEWVDLFQKAGAKFAGPVAEHHDGFAMWASKVTPWNAKDKGPKRDVLGELFKELRKRDMKTIATFHHARHLQRYSDSSLKDTKSRLSHYPYLKGLPTASDDPELRLLYGNVPEKEWLEKIWFGKLKEVIDNYQPDIIWFDSWLDRIPEENRFKFCAYYLNQADKWGKHVAIIRKQKDLPLDFTINDHEKSREPKVLKELWMTDDTISNGSWCYTKQLQIKTLETVVHAIIDSVSKNGVVLLNISPKADGTIPDNQKKVLLGLGKWLKANGEAIYATRPWINPAEGPVAAPEGRFRARKKFLELKYTAQDIRYTASKDRKTIFAMALGIPEEDSIVLLKTFAEKKIVPRNVTQMNGDSVKWEMTSKGLSITMPPTSDESSIAFKISL